MTIDRERLQTPDFNEVMRQALDNRLAGVHVSLPGRVESFDSGENRANVKPLIRLGRFNEDTGVRDPVSLPVVPEVPVILYGSGGVRIKIPIKQGDTGLLVFCEASLDRWLRLDGEVDPEDDRRFDLSDAVFIPGLQSFRNAGDATPLIEFSELGEIKLGANAIDGIIKGTSFNSALQTWLAALLTYIVIPVPTPAQTTAYTAAHNVFAAAAAAAVSLTMKTE